MGLFSRKKKPKDEESSKNDPKQDSEKDLDGEDVDEAAASSDGDSSLKSKGKEEKKAKGKEKARDKARDKKDKKEKDKSKEKKEKLSREEEEKAAFRHDLNRAGRFYTHAKTTSDSSQWDYSLEMFISGLRHDPDNLDKHKELFEVAKKRRIHSGKPKKIKPKDKTALERMLAAEHTWANDIVNFGNMMAFLEGIVATAEVLGDEVQLQPVAEWIGEITVNEAKVSEKTNVITFVKLRDTLKEIGLWELAREACAQALVKEPDDPELMLDLKNIDAEISLQTQKRTAVKAESGEDMGLHITVRNEDQQRSLTDNDSLIKTQDQLNRLISDARKRSKDNPEDFDLAIKLVNLLKQKETPQEDKEAIGILQRVHETTGEYKHKAHIGDIKIAQMERLVSQLKEAVDKKPNDAEAVKKYKHAQDLKAKFELTEYRERAKMYPTDSSLKYELGKRNYYFRNADERFLDEAIKAFQDSQSNPKLRSQAMQYLGTCYVAKGWIEEAVANFRRAVEIHPVPDDKIGMGLRYSLMDALERSARSDKSLEHAEEARRVASQILQTDIGYRDIKNRVDGIKSLITQLRDSEAA